MRRILRWLRGDAIQERIDSELAAWRQALDDAYQSGYADGVASTCQELAAARGERDEARRLAEEAADAGVEEGIIYAEEAVLPWESYTAAVLRRGGKLDDGGPP